MAVERGECDVRLRRYYRAEEDAPVQLGVGKNMVRSICYWCTAFKLLQDDIPTEFGESLLGEQGWDTFLEDPCYATA